MSDIVLASNNAGKIAEFNALFSGLNLNIIAQGTLGIGEAEENADTFVENALIKARHAAKAGGKAALADDSGLVVPALGGAPGVYSARYAGRHGDDAANNAKLLAELADSAAREAYFVCIIAYLRHADDPLPIIAQGIWQGSIAHSVSGANGFGYDPLFIPQGMNCSSAQLSPEEKNALSHRGQAMQSLMRQLHPLYAKES
ncbi:RdgB/HAM1 family non-canonical purine NTP pyrophosphatase [Suttonella indologenes]|uniref:dITP/XTP pyrophosphatase n=1 Tax=Suttonella indologenes TaxID=13276 RepID=A0A380N0T4_9GAMM|nr:RdgB/HAM1 family non-canonical purine NTP pyrophosphatase [Suttonella indologenes]SUO98172.1 dITP/XTP pyrophosphatase [Suttonella indologenes]